MTKERGARDFAEVIETDWTAWGIGRKSFAVNSSYHRHTFWLQTMGPMTSIKVDRMP